MKKTLGIAVILILLVSIPFVFPQKPGEVQTLSQILPIDPRNSVADPHVFVSADGGPFVDLPKRQINDLFYALDEFRYQQVASALEIESYGCIRYFADGRNIELLLSDEQGGSILVNNVDTDGREPVYQVSAGAEELKKLFYQLISSK